jgi:hypothetical protein
MKLVDGQTAQIHEDTPIWNNGMMEYDQVEVENFSKSI